MWVQIPPSPLNNPILYTLPTDKYIKLIDFISQKLNISKNKAKQIIDQKRVFVNQNLVWIASFSLKPNDIVQILPEKNVRFGIIYEDENLLISSKSPNLIVNESPNSLENFLRKDYPNIKAVHRIDKDTSGIVVFAKNNQTFEKLKSIWNSVEKTYYCISINEANFGFREIDLPIGGKKAFSTVILISKNKGLSLFKVRIFTGRRHQIRIHLNSIGFPILGDYVYGPKRQIIKVNRQMLHSYKIEFLFEGKRITVSDPLPEDMLAIINKYGLSL